jgi:hypothetical protein
MDRLLERLGKTCSRLWMRLSQVLVGDNGVVCVIWLGGLTRGTPPPVELQKYH